jgi:L-2-hydroxyglutarate oxidase LhgO
MASSSISSRPSSDFLILGAGIVGLTAALELKRRHPGSSITILEKEPEAGMHASGRNSGVLHSGIYYPAHTLKAQVCTAGSRAMHAFAEEHGITCRRSGKVIIAASEKDRGGIDTLMKNAADSGIRAERLDSAGIRKLEPHAQAEFGGLYSPDTSVIDSGAVVRKCVELLREAGVELQFNTPVTSADPKQKVVFSGIREFAYGYLINCAGGYADVIARWFGLAQNHVLVPFKGIYFELTAQRDELVRGSIYPVPNLELPFLGIHFTRVANGHVYVGPTAIPALGRENYGLLAGAKWGEALPIISQLINLYRSNQNNMRKLVNVEVRKYLKSYFVTAAQKLVPEVKSADLVPSSKVGIRPQLINIGAKRLEMDYVIETTPATLHVLNAISPAFTSSFAFAKHIVNQITFKS